MSEHLDNRARLAHAINEKIRPQWAAFEELSQRPSVQSFCTYESRYENISSSNRFRPDADVEEQEFLLRLPRSESFSPDEAAESLHRTNQRLDSFLEGVVEAYCNRKRIALPEDENVKFQILSKLMSGGASKIHEYMIWSAYNSSNEKVWTFDQLSFLPVSLVMLGARLKAGSHYDTIDGGMEANASQQEIDSSIDSALQDACAAVQQNKKFATSKTDSPENKAFAASMNCLRTLYHANKDRGLKEMALMHYSFIFFEQEKQKLDNPDNDALERATFTAYNRLSAHFKKVVDMDFSVMQSPLQTALLFDQVYTRSKTIHENDEKFWRSSHEFESRISSLHAARSLVDGIASGELKYSEIMKAMMALREQPLYSAETEPQTAENLPPDEWVNWEILPPGLLEDNEGNPSGDDTVQDPYDHERQVDWKRLWRLQNYAKGWGDAYFARTTIPNLPHDKQYYAVIMPEIKDDITIEHAVADHPETGNGMYVWRGEVGVADGAVRLSWREVMAQPRMRARKLGARCLYHTVNLETNLLEYLTASEEDIRRRRFKKQ